MQFIEKLLKLDSTLYYVENSKDCNRDNRYLYKRDNLFNAIKDTKNFIMLITKTIIITQIRESISDNQQNRVNRQILAKKNYTISIDFRYYICNRKKHKLSNLVCLQY